MPQTEDPRLRENMTSLVKHLHGFVAEVGLTEEEFREATAILDAMGQMTTDTHNEFLLMAGSLGVSSLVCRQNNGAGGQTETSQSLLGPFWWRNSPRLENGGSIIRSDTPGTPLFVTARVQDLEGRPILGAEVAVWHASPVGLYEHQDPEQAGMNLRGKLTTDADGRFWFWSVRMVGYAIPPETMVGRLLAAQHRHPYRPAHQHALILKDGYKTLIFQVFDPSCPWIATEVQFGVTRALTGTFTEHAEPHPDHPEVGAPGYGSSTPMAWNRARRSCRALRSSRGRHADRRRTPRRGEGDPRRRGLAHPHGPALPAMAGDGDRGRLPHPGPLG